MVFNKIDAYREKYFDKLLDKETQIEILEELKENLQNNYEHPNVFISAKTKENINIFREKIAELVTEQYHIRYPYQAKSW